MCGIVGYTGTRPALDVLIRGLKRLEYRGYDSAGVALFQDGKTEVIKSQGKLENVEKLVEGQSARLEGARAGIGHTRWATHGKPTTQNAHPHQVGPVILVHNGIIENYQEIKEEILKKGGKPRSETDSELFGFLVADKIAAGQGLVDAVRESFRRLQGQCSVVVMSEKEPGVIVGARNGSPLVAARDPKGGAILASDAQPILEYARDVVFLENGDLAIASAQGLEIRDISSGKKIDRKATHLDWSPEVLDKQGYAHYMLKEIHEQPTALIDTLNVLCDRSKTDAFPMADQPETRILREAREITLVACGTSWHAALLGKYWIEGLARVPVNVELASEYRYRSPVLKPGQIVIGLSQSGETADTLAVIREVRRSKIPTLGITNVRGSSLSREADGCFFTSAGPEIGVAATKTFSTQLLTLLVFAGCLARSKNPKEDSMDALFRQTVKLPHVLKSLLTDAFSEKIRAVSRAVVNSKGFFFIGRGFSFPIALEGALKLKEIAYFHAEGYAAGELKHGPIAMIDENMTVVVLSPEDSWRDKTVSNLEEVKARGARIVAIGSAGDKRLSSLADEWIEVPKELSETLLPFVLTPVIQLLSYELAVLRGTDVDKPRNLAKSVTVE